MKGADYELTLKIYPDAHHGFDIEGLKIDQDGHQLEYEPAAAADAITQTRDFLAKYLRTSR